MTRVTKKAIMYGAGNIGRGFIAQLFYKSGYETVFIDVNEELIDGLNTSREYPIFITQGDDYCRYDVKNVRAINGRDTSAVAEEIATADVMATSVGVNTLKFIAKPIAEAIALRAGSGRELNIIICENLIDSEKYFRPLLAAELDKETIEYFNNKIGVVEASVGIMVPATPEKIKNAYPLAVCAEPYSVLPVDRQGFRGSIPEIIGMEPTEPFELIIRRKLFIHNMSHALTAYLGAAAGYSYIWQASGDFRIRYTVLGALVEASCALGREYNTDIAALIEFSLELIARYDNKLLGDTIERVGRDTKRKLSRGDRLIGIIELCIKHSLPWKHIAIGVAGGLLFTFEGDDSSQEVKEYTDEKGVAAALEKYSSIDNQNIVRVIEQYYNELKENGNIGL